MIGENTFMTYYKHQETAYQEDVEHNIVSGVTDQSKSLYEAYTSKC